jgi:hypothetical protein
VIFSFFLVCSVLACFKVRGEENLGLIDAVSLCLNDLLILDLVHLVADYLGLSLRSFSLLYVTVHSLSLFF